MTVTDCTFAGNSATSATGGVIYVIESWGAVTNCRFLGNQAAGIYREYTTLSGSLAVSNCVFVGNEFNKGAAAYTVDAMVTLNNCTIAGNLGGPVVYSLGKAIPLVNCIVWGNGEAAPIYSKYRETNVTYSIVQGGASGIGNSADEPRFVRAPWSGPDGRFTSPDDDYGDLRLRENSPGLDAGSNVAVPSGLVTDVAGQTRIQNGTVEMGAYEGPASAPDPRTIYVDVEATGNNDGRSWPNAFTDLQMALLRAVDGDTVRVANGTYRPTSTTDRTLSFTLRNSLAVYGGYAGSGSPDPDARDTVLFLTTLSGDIATVGVRKDNSYHVVICHGAGSMTILDGFTITAGGSGMRNVSSTPRIASCAYVANGDTQSVVGGGMRNESSSPALVNCVFVGNTASWGGAMANAGESHPTLTNCTIVGNKAADTGGGIYGSSDATNCIVVHIRQPRDR